MTAPSVYDYTGLTEAEYNMLRDKSREKGTCVLCYNPRKSEGDDFCETHRMVYNEWAYLYEVATRRIQDFELMNESQKLAEDLHIPVFNIPCLFDGIKKILEERNSSSVVKVKVD